MGKQEQDLTRERRIIRRELDRIKEDLKHPERFSRPDLIGLTIGDCDWRAEERELDDEQ